jgi:hypothetical protein
MSKQKQDGQLGETGELPPGVKLLRTLEGHKGTLRSVHNDPAVADLRESLRERETR